MKITIEKRNEIILDHIGLIWNVISHFTTNSIFDKQDYFQVASIGMIKAIESFDKNEGIKLATWMYKCMNFEILRAIKWRRKYNKFPYVSIRIPEFENDRQEDLYFREKIENFEDSLNLQDKMFPIDLVEERINNNEMSIHLQRYINTLTEKEQIVIKMCYGINRNESSNNQEIGNVLNLTRERIRQIHDQAIRKLRNKMVTNKEYKKLKESL